MEETTRIGRPPHEPTEESRELVRSMTRGGATQVEIGQILKIDVVTIRKYYRDELDDSVIEANAKVAESLFKMATSGTSPVSTFFWLKTRARWRETADKDIEEASKDIQISGGLPDDH